jgi:phosphatidate cytidylyltransferase
MTNPIDVTADPSAAPPPQPSGRRRAAGRNLPVAVAVGAVLGGLVLVTVYRVPVGFVAVMVVAFEFAVAELVTAVMGGSATVATPQTPAPPPPHAPASVPPDVPAPTGTPAPPAAQGPSRRAPRRSSLRPALRPPRLPLLAGTAAIVVCAYLGGVPGLAVGYAATVLAIVFWRLLAGPQSCVRDISAGVWIATYVPFLGGFAALMFAQSHGADRIVVFVATTICSDIGGYAAGVLLGRHLMAEQISPKKTWEGFGGSVVACLLCGWLMGNWLLGMRPWQGLVLGAAVVVVATMGDLAESAVKRDLGVKDLGRLLPGHGGFMDRLDSLLPVAPVAYVLLTVFVGG